MIRTDDDQRRYRKEVEATSRRARAAIAAKCSNAKDFTRIGEMLGVIRTAANSKPLTATPWDGEDGMSTPQNRLPTI